MKQFPKRGLRTPAPAVIPTLVNEYEAARLIGYTVEGLRTRRYAGVAPAWYKIGHFVRYAPKDLQDWINSSRRKIVPHN